MDALTAVDVELVRAGNPGPFTLEGSNSWLVGRDGCWIVDPGPEIDSHLDLLAEQAQRRGGVEGIVLTHGHGDHADGLAGLLARVGNVPVGAAEVGSVRLVDGERFGPFEVLETPGHAPDCLSFLAGPALFTGDAVLGHGSVFVAPDPGAMTGYLGALERLLELEATVLCPGHGPVVLDPQAKLSEYLDHRLDRERRLLDALDDGLRTTDGLLDRVWADAPGELRGAALLTLVAHLDRLTEDGLVPDGVERPEIPQYGEV
ncbi:MAG: MBL fold metallo-hydrolase [Solirubrobacterales bacterium]